MEVKTNYYSTGNLRSEIYIQDGLIHRDDGPAIIEYQADGTTIMRKSYYQNNRKHRRAWPAVIQYEDGRQSRVEYWENGERMKESLGGSVINFLGQLLGVDSEVLLEDTVGFTKPSVPEDEGEG